MAERRQYSLRSSNAEVIHVPIHIQSARDTEFLSMLQNQHASTEENSDSASDSEQNEEALVGQSGTEQTASSENTVENIPGSSNAAGSSILEGSTQQAINLQILNQLGNIGKRLDAIERKGKNKTSDPSKIKKKKCQIPRNWVTIWHCIEVQHPIVNTEPPSVIRLVNHDYR